MKNMSLFIICFSLFITASAKSDEEQSFYLFDSYEFSFLDNGLKNQYIADLARIIRTSDDLNTIRSGFTSEPQQFPQQLEKLELVFANNCRNGVFRPETCKQVSELRNSILQKGASGLAGKSK